jgi:preprotein translocase subunit SecA
VTIATNMAGRGTDILLGGNPQALAEDEIRQLAVQREAPVPEEEQRRLRERYQQLCEGEHNDVVAAGGLHVLGTERHEARRIDNQLRGRSGRQGDPGSSRFYLSLEDDLMRIFGSDRIARLMEFKWFQWEEGLPIEHGMVTKAIETAQRRVEGHNFDIRKQLLEYDNTMNRQREVIYEQRRRILDGVDLQGMIRDIISEVADSLLDAFAAKELRPDAWDLKGLQETVQRQFGVAAAVDAGAADREAVYRQLAEAFERAYGAKRQAIGEPMMGSLERTVMLSIMDAKWKDHLYLMDALREGIHLRAYGQRDPLVEYQREAYRMFQDMTAAVKGETLMMLLRVQPVAEAQPVSVFAKTPTKEVHPEASQAEQFIPQVPSAPESAGAPFGAAPPPPPRRPGPPPAAAPVQRAGPKVGRNDPCPCGSNLKYKKCHGK